VGIRRGIENMQLKVAVGKEIDGYLLITS